MCQFKSALCLKDRVFVPDYDSHAEMLKELGIKDDYLGASKKFVRVELAPKDDNKTSDPMTWRLKVDQDITPEWFDIRADEQRIKEAVAEWAKVHILRDGEHEVHDGVWYAYGSARVKAHGSATVYAYDSATVYAYDSATVEATGSATVILPKLYQTNKPVTLEDEAICINHKDHTIRSKVKWTQEE